MIMLSQRQSLGFRLTRPLTRVALLTLTFGLAACAGHPFVGRWDCGQTEVNSQDFSGVVTNEFHYFEDQTFTYNISYYYDFIQAGSLKIIVQAVGTYDLSDTVFTEQHESTTVVTHESDFDISENALAGLIAAIESKGQTWDYSFEFPSADVLNLKAVNNNEAFTCRRVS